jgi:hypothetical protein
LTLGKRPQRALSAVDADHLFYDVGGAKKMG